MLESAPPFCCSPKSTTQKKNKQPGFGDLQDIVTRFKNRKPKTDTDRKQKFFFVPRKEIKGEDKVYDLSFSKYKEDVFEEIHYEAPSVILGKLIKAEVGDTREEDLAKIQSGIVRKLLELRSMIG